MREKKCTKQNYNILISFLSKYLPINYLLNGKRNAQTFASAGGTPVPVPVPVGGATAGGIWDATDFTASTDTAAAAEAAAAAAAAVAAAAAAVEADSITFFAAEAAEEAAADASAAALAAKELAAAAAAAGARWVHFFTAYALNWAPKENAAVLKTTDHLEEVPRRKVAIMN